MNIIVTATYGAVLAGSTSVYYVPTKKPPRGMKWPATTEQCPDLKRDSVATIDASSGDSVELTPDDLSVFDGVLSFCGKLDRATSRASDWAQIEELVGPLRYRDDVENAAMYWVRGQDRPQIPVRVASRGLGAIGLYLLAHDHRPWAVARALGLTYAKLFEHLREDVYEETPSFNWEDDV
ncbi:hypothetical protein [Halorubrum coriense]|uniref:hypothetical protein n=1 Tax=Halorubrum coriense TaxID=64713 RepID=UPI00126935D4|nr:hypothetical protein [Halorubrum coriense]